ncbi:MAG: hypothetical protein U0Z75_07280 [Deinococcaceae bacterium]
MPIDIEFYKDQGSSSTSYVAKLSNGQHVRCSSEMKRIVETLASGISMDAVLQPFETDERHAIQASLERMGLGMTQIKPKKTYIAFQKTLIPSAYVNVMADFLKNMFDFKAVIAVLLLCLYVPIFFRDTPSIWDSLHLTRIQTTDFGVTLTYLCLVFLGSLFHELGHAAALRRHGLPCQDIRLGVYWFSPVMFTDTTLAWSLTHKQRLAVDLGGVYFQWIFITLCLIGYAVTHQLGLLIAIVFLTASMVFALFPFIKMDGYWIASDLLGTRMLHAETRQFFAEVLSTKRIPKRSLGLKLYALGMFACAVMGTYYAATNIGRFATYMAFLYGELTQSIHNGSISGILIVNILLTLPIWLGLFSVLTALIQARTWRTKGRTL